MTRETRQIVKNEVIELNNIQPYSFEKYIKFTKRIIEKHPLTYFSLVKGMRFALLWNDIISKTSFLNSYFSPNAATRVFYYINQLDDIKHCETCSKPILKNLSAVGNIEHFFCCNRCAQKHESTILKSKATKMQNHGDPNYNNTKKNRHTCKERYGVEYVFQCESIKQKSKETLLKNYGVDHQMRSDEVKDGMKARYKAKHGVDYAFQNPEVQEKIKANNRAKLGVDWPMQNKELHKVMHANSIPTKKRIYFNDVIMKYDNVEPLFTEDDFAKTTGGYYTLKWRCKECGNIFEQEMFRHGNIPRCFACHPLLTDDCSSNAEIDMFNFMCSIEGSKYECVNGDILNWTTLKNRRQLDVVCIRKDTGMVDLAFEFNGLYWHQMNSKNANYHLDKTIECESLGIKLVHIWEDEWTNSSKIKDQISAFLRDEMKTIYDNDVIELDRSKFCRLCIPLGYELVEQTAPITIEKKDSKGNVYLVENCGSLICRKIKAQL